MPGGTDLGHVYVSYIADALAFAVDPMTVTHHDRLWTGRKVAPPRNLKSRRNHASNLWAQIASAQREPRGEGGAADGAGVVATSHVLPAPLSREVDQLRGVRCYGWAGRSVAKKGSNRGAWPKSVVSGVAWAGDGLNSSGWAFTNVEVMFDGQRWVPLAKRSKKPGLTSVTPGDSFEVAVDTSLREEADAASPPTGGATGYARQPNHEDIAAASLVSSSRPSSASVVVPVLQVTFLESYEQVGILRVSCVRACTCAPLHVDTLQPRRRFATLSTALSGPVTRAERCVLRVTNESPAPMGNASRTKVKLVSLAVLSKQVPR